MNKTSEGSRELWTFAQSELRAGKGARLRHPACELEEVGVPARARSDHRKWTCCIRSPMVGLIELVPRAFDGLTRKTGFGLKSDRLGSGPLLAEEDCYGSSRTGSAWSESR